jgi:hypothetical protein
MAWKELTNNLASKWSRYHTIRLFHVAICETTPRKILIFRLVGMGELRNTADMVTILTPVGCVLQYFDRLDVCRTTMCAHIHTFECVHTKSE